MARERRQYILAIELAGSPPLLRDEHLTQVALFGAQFGYTLYRLTGVNQTDVDAPQSPLGQQGHQRAGKITYIDPSTTDQCRRET